MGTFTTLNHFNIKRAIDTVPDANDREMLLKVFAVAQGAEGPDLKEAALRGWVLNDLQDCAMEMLRNYPKADEKVNKLMELVKMRMQQKIWENEHVS